MKKIAALLLGALSFISIVFSLNQLKTQYQNEIASAGYSSESFDLFIHPTNELESSQLLELLENLSSQYDAVFMRTDTMYQENEIVWKSVVLPETNENQFAEAFPSVSLAKGSWPESWDEFVSTDPMPSSKQTGVIRSVFPDPILNIGSLRRFFLSNPQSSVAGQYTVAAAPFCRKEILKEISQSLNQSEESLQEVTFSKTYQELPAWMKYGAIGMILLLFFAVCLYLPFAQAREIALLQLQGWKKRDVFFELYRKILLIPGPILLAGLVYLKLKYPGFGYQQLLFVACHVLALWAIAALIFGGAFMISSQEPMICRMKGKVHTALAVHLALLLKMAVLLMMIFSIPNLMHSFQVIHNRVQALQMISKQANELILSTFDYTGNEFQETMNGDPVFVHKLSKLFFSLEDQFHAYFYKTRTIPVDALGLDVQDSSSLLSLPGLISCNQTNLLAYFEISPGYLSQHPELSISSQLPEDNQILILYPQNQASESFKQAFEQYIQLYPSKNPQLIHGFYPSGSFQTLVSNQQLLDAGVMKVDQPVLICLGRNMLTSNWSFTTSGIANPFRIPAGKTSAEMQSIQDSIALAEKECDLAGNHLDFDTLSQMMSLQQADAKRDIQRVGSLCLILITMDFALSWLCLRLYLAGSMQKILVRIMMGYKLYDAHRSLIQNFLLVDAAAFLFLVLRKPTWQSILCFLLFILADFLISLMSLQKMNRNVLSLYRKQSV